MRTFFTPFTLSCTPCIQLSYIPVNGGIDMLVIDVLVLVKMQIQNCVHSENARPFLFSDYCRGPRAQHTLWLTNSV